MKRLSFRQLCFYLAVGLGGCNIEVGNPDDEPHGQSRMTQSLAMNLASKQPCTTTTADCTAAPVILPDLTGANLTYEMTSIHLQLAGATLQPGIEQTLGSDINLLSGSTVQLTSSESQALGSGISLRFAAANQGASIVLSGNLTGSVNGLPVQLPLSIAFSDAMLATLPVPGINADVEGVLFDTNIWFDFSDARLDADQLFKGLMSGACANIDAKSCAQYRLNLSRKVADRIARSISAKMGAAQGRPQKTTRK